jgi:hypothetical protein
VAPKPRSFDNDRPLTIAPSRARGFPKCNSGRLDCCLQMSGRFKVSVVLFEGPRSRAADEPGDICAKVVQDLA